MAVLACWPATCLYLLGFFSTAMWQQLLVPGNVIVVAGFICIVNCQAHLMQQWSENFTGLSIAQLQFNVSHAWSALM